MNEKFIQRKQVIYELINDPAYSPMKAKEIAMLLQIPKENREELNDVLDALVREGKISVSTKGKYGKLENNAVTGTFESTQKGFGFVSVEGEEQDIYINEKDTLDAMYGDRVAVIITTPAVSGRRREGKVIKILEHAVTEVVGTFEKNEKFGFVVCDNQKIGEDIFIPKDKSMGAVSGHKVVVKITKYPQGNKSAEGVVTEILGHVNDPGVDILSIIRAYNIPMEFPKDVMKSLETQPDEVLESDKEGRLDIRSWQTVTIDGEDAKDLDDAITLSKEGEDYLLGVHIADVSHYVKEHSPLDKEALNRGTSVYLVDRVIPMLPHKLSNGICSLNQGCDRLALSCIMRINAKGDIIDHQILETVINVDRRMTYTSVKKILADEDKDEIEEYKELVPMFKLMQELSSIIRTKRYKRGSIDFDFPESKIILDKEGHPIDIKPYERNVATKIIEDFMLAANETVAEDMYWKELPFVYRTHDKPDPEKIIRLGTFINNFGYDIKIGRDEIHPKELQKLLDNITGSEEENMISRLTLRSMKRAQYTTECTGHFGLAARYYCHFTSPIRRYPDLQIHRIIKESLKGRLNAKRLSHYDAILSDVAHHSSTTERRADEAERETEKLKKVEYMEDRIGEEFDGVVSGITAFGIYVELPNTVEGLVHINSLKDDYYEFFENTYELIGERSHNKYVLGQKVKVRLTATDKLLKTIDFEIV